MFKVSAQTVDLVAPAGNENWPVGSVQTIQWSYSNINFLRIEYSIDGGLNFSTIVTSVTASSNHYYWTIPANVSNNCIVKISDFFSTVSSQSANSFSISNDPFINLNSLNGGEILTPATDTLITWSDFGISPTVKIEYSGNNGLNWITIVDNYPNTNSYLWTIPNTPSNSCLVKVSDAQNVSICDSSNSTFYITPLSSPISVFTPNGGEIWAIGYQQTTYWNASTISNVNIEISTDNGLTWNIIENNYPANDGYYTWTVAAPAATTSALVRVSDSQNPSIFDQSDFPFTIILPPANITLYYPNGGELIAQGLSVDITWNAINVNNLSIEYSINNGLSWNLITNSVPASAGSFSWQIPNIPCDSALVRLSDNSNSLISDQSTTVFSIIPPEISFQNFPIGSTYDIYTNLSLFWTSNGINNQPLKLEYSTNNGAFWITLANNVANSGSYNWLINCPPTDSCKLRISLQNNPTVFVESPGTIKIISTSPSIIVLSPTSQEILGSGTLYPITWFSFAVNYVRIEYSINGDTIFNLITPFAPAANGVYYWNVPANLNAINCKIKVSNAANTSLSALNPSVFSIQVGFYEITSGNSITTMVAGFNHQITWTSGGTGNYVNLDYSLDSINWIPIVSNYLNVGYYSWSVPYVSTNTLWYRVSDVFLNTIFDINNAPLIIVENNQIIEIVEPMTNANFVTDGEINISWNIGGIDSINIDYSLDGGLNWLNIVTNLNTSISNYIWNTGPTSINNGKLRISNSNNALQFDEIIFNTSNPYLNVITPNGNENWISNISQYITWESLGVNYVNLYLSDNNGTSWNLIDSNVSNIGYYNWTPLNVGNNFLIKIINSDSPFITDVSNATFNLVNAPEFIDLIAPNGNEILTGGTGTYIDWQSTGISHIDISFSLDGGSTYLPIASNIPSIPADYYWQVADSVSNTVKIRINKTGNANISSASDFNFSIIPNTSSLELLNPNGGEIINANTFYNIQWNANNCDFVKLYYSINGGITYNFINSIVGSNSFVWQIPTTFSSNCKIKIENGIDTSVYDVSNSIFQINNLAPGNQIISIDSVTNTFCSGDNFTLNYQVNSLFNTPNNFKVQLSDVNGNFTTFTEIGEILANTSGGIICNIPHETPSSTEYKFRIVADNPPVIGVPYNYGNITINKANANFTSNKLLTLLPNANVTLTPIINSNLVSSSSWEINNNIYNTYAPQVFFNQVGKYQITHEITESNGCSATIIEPKKIAVERLFYTEIIEIPSGNEIIDIEFENSKYGCAIFKNGNCIISSDSGKTWTLSYTPNNFSLLNSLTIQNNNWLIALENGNYLKSLDKGNTWFEFSFNNNEGLMDIVFTSSSNQIAIGKNGKIFKYNGTVWQNQTSGTNKNLNKIFRINNTTIVVGNDGTILKLQNNSWTTIQAPVNTNLNDVVFKDSINGYIAAEFGYILKTSNAGLSWNVVLSGADVDFKSVTCSGDSVWALGTSGSIYTSIDNGVNWKRYNIGTLDILNKMVYFNDKGIIVGENKLCRTFNNKAYFPLISQITEDNKLMQITCFPNPTQDRVNVKFSKESSNVFIKISNIQGKTIFENTINNVNTQGQLSLDLSKYKSGIYFISVFSEGKQQTFKVVKNN